MQICHYIHGRRTREAAGAAKTSNEFQEVLIISNPTEEVKEGHHAVACLTRGCNNTIGSLFWGDTITNY